MSAVDLAVTRLKIDEGYRANLYTDTTGHRTIGYGFNIDAGITPMAALSLLTAQTTDIAQALAAYWWASGLDDARLSVVIQLAFNLGLQGLLHFPKMLAALGAKDWQTAQDELLNSDAARELPTRYNALAATLLNGAS